MNTNNIPDLITEEEAAHGHYPTRTEINARHRERMAEREAQLAKVTAERNELRKIFPAILDACDNGSGCTESVSLEFLKEVPAEVRGVVQGLKREIAAFQKMRDEARAELAAMREAVAVTTTLAEWSARYPRGVIYSASNRQMDAELIELEERAKAATAKLQLSLK